MKTEQRRHSKNVINVVQVHKAGQELAEGNASVYESDNFFGIDTDLFEDRMETNSVAVIDLLVSFLGPVCPSNDIRNKALVIPSFHRRELVFKQMPESWSP